MSNLLRAVKIKLVLSLRYLGIAIPPIPTVSGIFLKDQKILMIKLSYKEGYALPGGGVNPHESLEEALIREVNEEINCKPENLKYYGSAFTNKEGLPMLHMAFTGELPDTTLTGSAEGTPEWLSYTEALNKCVYQDQLKILKTLL